ncbi:deaminase [Micromonospora echinospora]
MNDSARQFMQIAVDEARKSPEGKARVGAALVRDDGTLVRGHKGELGNRVHAEEVVLSKAKEQGVDTRGSTVFVTLEPCANSRTNRKCCADLLVAAGVRKVYIGRYDINPQIYRLGWRVLVNGGVECRDFDADFREELKQITIHFERHFLQREGLQGTAKFDFTQNGGKYDFTTDDTSGAAVWTTRWGSCGTRSVYAVGGHPGIVAHARFATRFDQIDDPDALDYGSHFAKVDIGDIAVFRNDHGHVLCRVLDIEPPPPYGEGPHISVKVAYQIRLKANTRDRI